MKKIIPLIIITLILSTQITKSQTYDPIVDTNKLWSTGSFIYNGVILNSFYIKFDEDTTIDNYEYKKIFKSYSETMNSFSCIGFARENNERQVYFRNLNNQEGLVYDFGVEQGDTIDFYNPVFELISLQLKVDSVFYEDFLGIERKVIGISPIYGNKDIDFPDTFIEGVGSLDGIVSVGFRLSGLVGGFHNSLCAHYNDEIIYNNPDYNSCFLTTSITDIKKEDNLKIYPNPTSEYINITANLENNTETKIELISSNGSCLKTKTCRGKIKEKIDVSDLPKGFYLLKFTSDNKVETKKVIIAN